MRTSTRGPAHKWLAMVAAAALFVAACGDDDDGGADSPDEPASLEGEPVRLMVTGTHQSEVVNYGHAVDAASAAADAINGAGGIDGHPIEILDCNDGFDANQAAACAQEGIDAGATAFVGSLILFNGQVLPLLGDAGIPWVGAEVLSPDQMTHPSSYPLDAGIPMTFIEMGRQLVEQAGPEVLLVQSENPNSQYNAQFIERGVDLAGGEIVDTVQFALTQDDFAVTGAQIADAGADGVGCSCSDSNLAQILPAARGAGYEGPIGATLSAARDEDLVAMGDDSVGDLVVVAPMRVMDDPDAEIAQLLDETAEVPEGVVRDAVFARTWLAVHVVADALEGAEARDAATLVERLADYSAPDTFGLLDALDFGAEPPLPEEAARLHSVDVFIYTWEDGRKVAASDSFVDPLRD